MNKIFEIEKNKRKSNQGGLHIETIKPNKLGASRIKTSETKEKLTSAELGKLWATYMGNSMSRCVLSYFLEHTVEPDIRKVVEKALHLSEQFIQTIKDIYIHENHPIPIGFTQEDVNVGAPRLFLDEFYPYYLRYIAKAGLSIYGVAVPLMSRADVRTFFTQALDSTVSFINEINDILINKGSIKPPYIPVPRNIEFIQKQSYFNGFLGDVRPLHALEITHLYDNILDNVTSGTVLTAFAQTAKHRQIREYFIRGEELVFKHLGEYNGLLTKDDLPTPPMLTHLATDSTFAPFSDKLMLFHKIDMFSMRIRSYGNSMAVNGRHDVGAIYSRFAFDAFKYVHDGTKIMIDMGWMEQPPHAADRDALILK